MRFSLFLHRERLIFDIPKLVRTCVIPSHTFVALRSQKLDTQPKGIATSSEGTAFHRGVVEDSSVQIEPEGRGAARQV